MVHVNKLRKTIGRLEVKCKNAEAGCLVTCPLAHRKGHQDACPFEQMTCPNEGCTVRVPRGALAEHRQHCQQGGEQRCVLGLAERAHRNCHHELRNTWSARQERSGNLVLSLLRHVRRVHRTTNLIRRQLAQLGNFLGAAQDEAETILEGSVVTEV
ncbi:RING finger protein 151 isoform X2 [Castor canadensis]|nr:RING finger protein 151 [Castor canadensis]